ncbi:MAG TPA: prepilin-type N-terminal cleavage/methylation domain-containing protein [Pyrinomonadaceae bacterium]|jgi:prepilin-type N-terminal cleavage/methylation domain-containing protein
MMKRQERKSTRERVRLNDESGASIIEILIVLAIIGVASTWAFMRIVEAQQATRLASATQELTAYLDKARQDSIRRHATAVNRMARVSITSATSYSVTLDADGDGQLDAPRVFNFQPGSITFNVAAFPTTIMFNWRGRIVDGAGNQTNNPASINLQDTHGPGPAINLSAAGDTTTYSNVNITNVNVSGVNTTANIRTRTQVPK